MEIFRSMTELQQDVVINRLSGMTNRDAYLNSGGRAEGKNSVDASASRILSGDKPKKFIEGVKRLKFSEAIMSREEMGARLSELARTEMRDVVEFGEVDGQSVWKIRPMEEIGGSGHAAIKEISTTADGAKIKIHDQLIAMKQLAQLYGYDSPQEVNVNRAITLEDLYDGFEGEGDQASTES